jgi:hypothetical protein
MRGGPAMAKRGEKTKKQQLAPNDACVCMHTALRKCCDSRITSAAYNLIHLIHIEPSKWNAWVMLGRLVVERMEGGKKPAEALQEAIERLEDAFYDQAMKSREAGESEPDQARSIMYALRCTLECFSPKDIEGMAEFLG